MLGRKLKNEINLISIKNILKKGGRVMPATLDDLKKYEEAAHALCFGGKNFAAFHIFRKKIISHASDKLNSIQRAQRHLF